MAFVLNILFLFLIEAPSICQSLRAESSLSQSHSLRDSPASQSRYLFNPCLYNREDILPCRDYYNAGVVSPGTNQYTVHATRFQRHPQTGNPICIKRKHGELVQNVEDLGSPLIKFLFSPGAERIQPVNYVNQMLVEYNISCETGLPAFIQFEALNLEPVNCEQRCRDYIEIDTGAGGRMEFCGNNQPNDSIIVQSGRFILKLRTSFYSSYPGFRVFVTCISNRSTGTRSCRDYGGSPRKRRRAPYTLVDLYAIDNGNINRSPAFPLTSDEKESLKSMADSLFNVALSQARRKITSWPPPSYSQNDPNDILVLSELNSPPTQSPPTLPPTPSPPPRRRPFPPPLIDRPSPNYGDRLPHPVRRRKRVSTLPVSGLGTVQLNSSATLEAVRNENSCNPVLHSVSSSYLTIAQRLDPRQVQVARVHFREELTTPHIPP